MDWNKEVTKYILENLVDYAKVILDGRNVTDTGKAVSVNPCPYCDHHDCFYLTHGFNGGHCFSCGMRGNLIALAQEHLGEDQGLQRLADWSGIPYVASEKDKAKAMLKEKSVRLQRIYQIAVDYYQKRLFQVGKVRVFEGLTWSEDARNPAHYQIKIAKEVPGSRNHDLETVKKFKIGYSDNFNDLVSLLIEKGFPEEDIKEASKLIRVPDGYYVYPYYDAKGNIVRFNCRAFYRSCKGKPKADGKGHHYDCKETYWKMDKAAEERHKRDTGHSLNGVRISRGSKEQAYFYNPSARTNKKYAILVEGENDVQSTDEALAQLPPSYYNKYLVIGIGGKVTQGFFDNAFFRSFEEIYEAFDNDETGNDYREQLDKELPDVPVKRLNIPKDSGDPDEFFKFQEGAIDIFKDLLDNAEFHYTEHFRIWRSHRTPNIWNVQNRSHRIEYKMDKLNSKTKKYMGTVKVYQGDRLTDQKLGDLGDSVNLGKHLNDLRLGLTQAIDNHYQRFYWNNDRPERPYDELLEIYRFARNKEEIRKQIAWYIHHANPGESMESKVQYVKTMIHEQIEVDYILKEVNGFANDDIDKFGHFPKMKIAQSFYPRDGLGYLYFVKTILEDGTLKRVPCLISNKKEEIRLDLLKKKDPKSLLLINNKYELPRELDVDYTEGNPISLQYKWVDKWSRGDLSEDDISPQSVISEIEAFIRETFIANDDTIKVVALWIFATYFYTIFSSGFPYIMVNGGKGTGKTTLDKIINLLSFNSTFAVDATDASLLRIISHFGGTLILDEVETLNDRKKVDESGKATILKSGYSEGGYVLRTDPETNLSIRYYTFGPKVISNINGLDSVLLERCIEIRTFAVPESDVRNLTDIDEFNGARREEVFGISSRAALCALTHFEEVYEILLKDTRHDTGNLRLTQILRPLVTMARFVGDESYEKGLMSFYETEIVSMKDEVNLSTLEGKIKHILYTIAEEILEVGNKGLNLIHATPSGYKKVSVNQKDEVFTIDNVQLKLLAEEMDVEMEYSLTEVNKAVKQVMGKKMKDKPKRTRTSVGEELAKNKFKNARNVHIYVYTFSVRDFIPRKVQSVKYGVSPTTSNSLF